MDFYLSKAGCDVEVRVRFPAAQEDIWHADAELAQYSTIDAPVQIWRVVSPINNLTEYVRCADLGKEADIEKLNSLVEKIDGMSQQEQRIFSGTLASGSINGLDDVLHIADSLGHHELQESTPELSEEKQVLRLSFSTGKAEFSSDFPVSDERLEQMKTQQGLDDYAQLQIMKIEAAPGYAPLEALLPADSISLEEANDLASYVEVMSREELRTYYAALSAEDVNTFSAALSIAMDLDDYESVSNDEWEYGRVALRRIGADDEILDTLDGYTDFGQLGRDAMEEDGIRQTEFGPVRRISSPFEEQLGMAQQMQ